MTFEELNLSKSLLNALSDLGYVNPTPIQREAFAPIMAGKDVVGVAQTGTGKTFAYVLPILRLLKYSNQINPRILILVPTRELVLQVVDEIKKLTTYMSVRVGGVYGGTNIRTQKTIVYEGLDILVGTPGRVLDLALDGALKLKNIKQLVIDEVDEMMDLGFQPQIIRIMDLLPEKRKNLLFSATMPPKVETLIEEYFVEPQKIEIARHGTPLEQIIQKAYHVPNFFTKVNVLQHLLSNDESMEKILVFTGGKKLADRLFEKINISFPDKVGILHSNKSQNFRIRNLESFSKGEFRIMITTDIMARGLDISDVSHVVNFDLPNNAPTYIHRIGRTGRAEKEGIAISFINEVEEEYQIEIEELMQMQIPMEKIPEEVEISDVFSEEEKPKKGANRRPYLVDAGRKSKGAYHEKKEKNKKVNLGGKFRRTERKTKTVNRGRLKRNAKKKK